MGSMKWYVDESPSWVISIREVMQGVAFRVSTWDEWIANSPYSTWVIKKSVAKIHRVNGAVNIGDIVKV